MTNHDFRVGDIVSVTGTVAHAGSAALSIDTDNGPDCIWAKNATLVERPEPKISVELTYDQLDSLCLKYVNSVGFGIGEHPLYKAFSAARSEALDAQD